jgi:P27 family predicted phage terminase small subunit
MKGSKPTLQTDSGAIKRMRQAPNWLSSDAKSEWKRALPGLIEREILTEADMPSFENYCISIGRVREAEKEMQSCKDTELKLKLFRMQDKAMQSARLLAAELGLTPVSRSRPAIRKGDDDGSDPLNVS